jgi:serine-aspartate repeat-containing protein C/D/E
VVGDWNGDGVSRVGVFRNGVWYLDLKGSGIWEEAVMKQFWGAKDIPVVGDWNGD